MSAVTPKTMNAVAEQRVTLKTLKAIAPNQPFVTPKSLRAVAHAGWEGGDATRQFFGARLRWIVIGALFGLALASTLVVFFLH